MFHSTEKDVIEIAMGVTASVEVLLEVNYQLHCKYLRENKETGFGNGQKLVNIHNGC